MREEEKNNMEEKSTSEDKDEENRLKPIDRWRDEFFCCLWK